MRYVATAKSNPSTVLSQTTLATVAILTMTENIEDAAVESSRIVELSYPSKTEPIRDAGTEFKVRSSEVATLRIIDAVCDAASRNFGLTERTVYMSWTAEVKAKLQVRYEILQIINSDEVRLNNKDSV